MGNKNNNSKKKTFTLLGLLLLVVGFIWFTLTGFEDNKDRFIFSGLFILFCGLLALGAFLKQKKE